MGFLDKLKQTAQAAVSTTTQAAKTVTAVASSARVAISSVSHSAYDRISEKVGSTIKNMVKGLDLQQTIDALDKHHADTGTDVRALREFVVKLKKFGENE